MMVIMPMIMEPIIAMDIRTYLSALTLVRLGIHGVGTILGIARGDIIPLGGIVLTIGVGADGMLDGTILGLTPGGVLRGAGVVGMLAIGDILTTITISLMLPPTITGMDAQDMNGVPDVLRLHYAAMVYIPAEGMPDILHPVRVEVLDAILQTPLRSNQMASIADEVQDVIPPRMQLRSDHKA